ncbi:chemotaxis protein CheB [Cupriavidus consociatus]|uniref:chemotaxis protein CheB n=1 Tax=Cupriavidus consociatus TaxID=2821357 RepID=UPI001AE3ACB0|nr:MULTISPECIES: chemotaxis protein CheB [unclassified Cupriavidus]MBP0623841.1 chemotaxis protein CheB [Cupriavidus sp. LEh25]MDK2660548.1 chemotaxis protein CheB [Cupriavidus sp. LEh21]
MKRDTIVLGTSSGGVDALRDIAAGLPPDLDATVLAVLHIGANPSMLPDMLTSVGPLPARHARDGEPLRPGAIYVAPPDQHLMIVDEHVRLVRGPKENFARPAIDPLFRSAAVARGNRVVAAVLTGQLDDGGAGLRAVRECGGVTIVQDPDSAFAADMPRNAIRASPPDYVLPLAAIAPKLVELAGSAAGPPADPPESLRIENSITLGPSSIGAVDKIALPSALTCPECGGALWQVREAVPPRFRCHTGHAFGMSTLRQAANGALEHTLFDALRALHEQRELYTQIAAYHMQVGETSESRRYTEAAGRAAASAKRIEGWLREG